MKQQIIRSAVALAVAMVGSGAVWAAAADQYPNPGTPNAKFEYLTVTKTGPVSIYFVARNGAPNLATTTLRLSADLGWLGDDLFKGAVNYGDKVQTEVLAAGTVVHVRVASKWAVQGINPATGLPWNSGPAHWGYDYGVVLDSPYYKTGPLINYTYFADFPGDAGAGIPAGLFAGFEGDLQTGDYDYNDIEVVFTNLSRNPFTPAK